MDQKDCGINKDNLIYILDRNTTWIENCDTKTSIILGMIGVILGILLVSDYVNKIAAVFDHMIENIGFWTGLHVFLSVISIFSIVIGVFFLVRVLVGKTDTRGIANKGIRGEFLSFFSSIAKHKTLQSYKAKLKKCSESSWIDEIVEQIYICSIICDRKFRNYKIGLILSVIGFSLFTVLMLIGVFGVL